MEGLSYPWLLLIQAVHYFLDSVHEHVNQHMRDIPQLSDGTAGLKTGSAGILIGMDPDKGA